MYVAGGVGGVGCLLTQDYLKSYHCDTTIIVITDLQNMRNFGCGFYSWAQTIILLLLVNISVYLVALNKEKNVYA